MTELTHATCADVEAAVTSGDSNASVMHTDPLVFTIDEFISQDDCDLIIATAQDQMRRAVVAGAAGGVESAGRTNSVAWLPHSTSPRFQEIVERVAATLGVPATHAENFQVIHYLPGAEYRTHYDAFDITTERGQRTMKKGGQRITTTLCYLNQVEAGGATGFKKLELQVTPAPGRLLAFNNCEGNDMHRSELSLHAGLPVEAGEKWAFNLWFREYPTSHNPVGDV